MGERGELYRKLVIEGSLDGRFCDLGRKMGALEAEAKLLTCLYLSNTYCNKWREDPEPNTLSNVAL